MRRHGTVETSLDAAVAAWMGGCTAYALALGAAPIGGLPSLLIALAGSALAAWVTFSQLQRLGGAATQLPSFELTPIESVLRQSIAEASGELLLTANMIARPPKLLLTTVQMLQPQPPSCDDELLLVDVLAKLQPDSRVVQLFDHARVPTAGELKARIDRHLSQARPAVGEQPDASQALYDALADLRRSLG